VETVTLLVAEPQTKLKDDPRYSKYFKMLALGVPKPAVRIKMQNDGVDADMIDMDPEGPAPALSAEDMARIQAEQAAADESDDPSSSSDFDD